MLKAAKQLTTTDEQVRRQELILTAPQAELDSIETQISNVRQKGNEAKKTTLNAIGLALDEEWNAASEQLVAVGARILAVSYQKVGSGMLYPDSTYHGSVRFIQALLIPIWHLPHVKFL